MIKKNDKEVTSIRLDTSNIIRVMNNNRQIFPAIIEPGMFRIHNRNLAKTIKYYVCDYDLNLTNFNTLAFVAQPNEIVDITKYYDDVGNSYNITVNDVNRITLYTLEDFTDVLIKYLRTKLWTGEELIYIPLPYVTVGYSNTSSKTYKYLNTINGPYNLASSFSFKGWDIKAGDSQTHSGRFDMTIGAYVENVSYNDYGVVYYNYHDGVNLHSGIWYGQDIIIR